MADVSIRALNKKYDNGFHAVQDLDLEIRDHEFVVLVGPSGCGKTTTLRMIAGLEEVTSGEIRIGDEVVNQLPPMDRNIAMVFQNYALYPHKTVFDNMAFGLQMRGYARPDIAKRVRDVAAILGIEALLERKPRQLSGGQRQRVAVGRAIVRHPQVFLFDEPLSNLDAKLRAQMRVELKRLHEQLETTVVYVTHDQVEAMTLGDRVVVMKDGRLQQVGAPLELYGKPANRFVAGFIGSPAMNFIDVSISSDGLRAETAGLSLPVPERVRARGRQRLTLGIRPEALRIADGADAHTFAATVEVIEPLGNEILLNFRAGGVPMVARVDPSVTVKVRESVRFTVDPERLHVFDPVSEAALR